MEESDTDKIINELQALKKQISELASHKAVEPRLLSVKDTAKYLGIGTKEVYSHLRSHVLSINHGKKILFPIEELDHLIERAKRSGELFGKE